MSWETDCVYCRGGNHETREELQECRRDYLENDPARLDEYSVAEVRDLHPKIKQEPFRERGPDTEE